MEILFQNFAFLTGVVATLLVFHWVRKSPPTWKCPTCEFKVSSNKEQAVDVVRKMHLAFHRDNDDRKQVS